MNAQSPDVRSLTVQGDRTVLLEVASPGFTECRDFLSLFAELEKSPEFFHTYRITPLSIWNAAAAGLTADAILEFLRAHARYPVPQNVERDVRENIRKFGMLRLERRAEGIVLTSTEKGLLPDLIKNPSVKKLVHKTGDEGVVFVPPEFRGEVKQALIRIGYPVEDLAGYSQGAPLPFGFRAVARTGLRFELRRYQVEAADVFWAGGSEKGGSGVIVLPCGAGKTVVGLSCMERLQTQTLVLTTNVVAVRQWKNEILDKTDIPDDLIGEYTGESKLVKPVTIATYQILTYRRKKTDPFVHFDLFSANPWGLVIYDEVHLLPAPVFRVTAEIQATRRLGLTATLVREDKKEDEVFSLIGPKKFDVPWKVLERQGFIATARCIELRVPIPDDMKHEYLSSSPRQQFRLASENPAKEPIVRHLLERHKGERVLIIGQYIDQLDVLAERLGAPLITGKTPNKDRERLYKSFREGEIPVLLVSKVGNFAIDLPDASVAIQVSGTFGSRQEEAQRLGRILRPKSNGSSAWFYTLVTRESKESEFANHRQLFLTEQGYAYEIRDVDQDMPEAENHG
ncbi:MAG: DEAD/DEAH box helicase [Planctomycetes bacterium]|nr:DEAD/DEAH box helicase [Planctomycetota bacterium]MCC7171035.1 DEAD/DEAH box helicase [Planctomycetota bacterium]